MVEELAEAVVRATGAAARGVAALFTVPETYAAAAEFATAEADRPRERKARKDEKDRGASQS
ncbi:hypothetical protein ACWENA_04235 [Streptomyces sp. NPDC004779]|uniref:hypothetical protein n=1 Tax=Streptomyces sp. NPDC056049 TaxID=3345693 RepID=UPI0035DF6D61